MLRKSRKARQPKSGLKKPKKLTKNCQNWQSSSAINGSDIYKSIHEKSLHGEAAMPPAPSKQVEPAKSPSAEENVKRIQRVVAEATEQSRLAHDKRKARLVKKQSVAALEELWAAAAKKTFPEMTLPLWTVKARGMVAAFSKQYRSQNQRGKGVWHFFDFAIANWRRVGQLKFRWMKDVEFPEYPDVQFLLGFKKHFLACYDDNAFLNRRVDYSKREQDYQNFLRMGYTPEQAEKAAERLDSSNRAIAVEQERADKLEVDVKHMQAEKEKLRRQRNDDLVEKDKLRRELEKAQRKAGIAAPAKPARKPAPKNLPFGAWEE